VSSRGEKQTELPALQLSQHTPTSPLTAPAAQTLPQGLQRRAVKMAKIRGDKSKRFAGFSVLFRQTKKCFHAWKSTASYVKGFPDSDTREIKVPPLC